MTSAATRKHQLYLQYKEDLEGHLLNRYGLKYTEILDGLIIDYVKATKPAHLEKLKNAELQSKADQQTIEGLQLEIDEINLRLSEKFLQLEILNNENAKLQSQISNMDMSQARNTVGSPVTDINMSPIRAMVNSTDINGSLGRPNNVGINQVGQTSQNSDRTNPSDNDAKFKALSKEVKSLTPFQGMPTEHDRDSAAIDLIRYVDEFESLVTGIDLTLDIKRKIFEKGLAKEARRFATRYSETNYAELLTLLKNRYLDQTADGDQLRQLIKKATIQKDEPMVIFGERLLDLARALVVVRGSDFDKTDLFNLLKDTFLSAVSELVRHNHFSVQVAINNKDFPKLIEEVDKAVQADPSLKIKHSANHLLAIEKDSVKKEKDQNMKCFRCFQYGHVYRQCPLKNNRQRRTAPPPPGGYTYGARGQSGQQQPIQ